MIPSASFLNGDESRFMWEILCDSRRQWRHPKGQNSHGILHIGHLIKREVHFLHEVRMIRRLIFCKTSLDRRWVITNLWVRIWLGILVVCIGFFEFEEVFLGMGAYLWAVSGLDDVLNFFPVFAKEFKA